MAKVDVLAYSQAAVGGQILSTASPRFTALLLFLFAVCHFALAALLLEARSHIKTLEIADETAGGRWRWPRGAHAPSATTGPIVELVLPPLHEPEEVADDLWKLLQRVHEYLRPLDEPVEVVEREAHAALLYSWELANMALAQHHCEMLYVQRLQHLVPQQHAKALQTVGAAGFE